LDIVTAFIYNMLHHVNMVLLHHFAGALAFLHIA